jgi:hypothetical protein
MDLLDKMTQISLDALWKIQIQECIDASMSSIPRIHPAKDTNYDSILYNMEEGILPPKPKDLPMPPSAWLN